MTSNKAKRVVSAADTNVVQEEDVEPEPDILEGVDNIAVYCTLENQIERFTRCMEDENDPFHANLDGTLNDKNVEGKTPIQLAAMLGRTDLLRELIKHGGDVHIDSGKSGYTALHYSAAWGNVDCIKALVENGSELQKKNGSGKRAREVAARYNKTECVDYLDWAEARQILQQLLASLQETITDPEKVQGKLSRDEKNIINNLIKSKTEWINTTTDATTEDFIVQKQEVDETSAPVLEKLAQT